MKEHIERAPRRVACGSLALANRIAKSRTRWLRFALLVLCAGTLLGCTPLGSQEQPAETLSVDLAPGHTLGQTFVARHAGLAGVEVRLRPDAASAGRLVGHLRAEPHATRDLASASLPIGPGDAPQWVRFTFEPRGDSRQTDYYFDLEYQGSGQLALRGGPGNAYLQGSLYGDGQPLEGQLAFRLVFDRGQALGGFLREALGVWLPLLGAGVLAYILPGLALLALLWPRSLALTNWDRLGLAGGFGLALYPLLLLFTSLIGLRLGSLNAWLPAGAALLVLAWRGRAWRVRGLAEAGRRWLGSETLWPDLGGLVALSLVVLTRLLVIGAVDIPLWGDSYQHTMIAQLLVDHGGLFNSWQPYAELQTLTYHFGFHSAVAVLHWVSGLAMPQATLWTGQIINVLAIMALYPLAARLGGNRWAGVAAMLTAGLLSFMPMFYVNWGRYTQLAGQVILPVAAYVAWVSMETPFAWRLQGLGWLIIAGLTLTHYRVLLFLLPFFAAYLILQFAWTRKLSALRVTGMLAVGCLLLCLPWLVHVYAGSLWQIFAQQIGVTQRNAPDVSTQVGAIGSLTDYLPAALWWLALGALAAGLWRRERGLAVVALWFLLVFLEVNQSLWGFKGTIGITNFDLFIAAYIPAGLVVGGLAGWLMGAKRKRGVQQAAFVGVSLLALWGASQRPGDMRIAQGTLATRPDMRAASWIQSNTPTDARFLVNSFFAYNNTAIVGSDGGWWLPLLARRQTTLPPLTYMSELGPRPDYREWTKALTAALQSQDIDGAEVQRLFRERGVTHVYIGQQQGTVNYAGPYPLKPERLLASPHLRPIYHEDRVWVFEVLPLEPVRQ